MAEGTAGTIPNRNAIHIHKRSRLQPPCATARSFTNKVYQMLCGDKARVNPLFMTLDVNLDQTVPPAECRDRHRATLSSTSTTACCAFADGRHNSMRMSASATGPTRSL